MLTEELMHRLIKLLLWFSLFLVMMLIVDQFLVQAPPVNPAHAAVRNFYLDLRNRIIEMAFGEKEVPPDSIEDVIEGRQQGKPADVSKDKHHIQQSARTAADQTRKNSQQRYIYSDSNGELQFADSLQEVPEKYRREAQPIGN
jgi:hypothetical protein